MKKLLSIIVLILLSSISGYTQPINVGTPINIVQTDCSTITAKGQLCYDSDDFKLYVGNGTSSVEVAIGSGGGMTPPYVFNDTVSLKRGATSGGMLLVYENSGTGTNYATLTVPTLGADYTYYLWSALPSAANLPVIMSTNGASSGLLGFGDQPIQTTSDVIFNKVTAGPSASQDRIIIQGVAKGAGQFDGTLSTIDLTGTQTWNLPNESGTICTTGSICSGYALSNPLASDTLWAAIGDLVIGTGNDTAEILTKGTEGQVLRVGASTLGYSTATYPATITTNKILYASSTDIIGGLATGNSGVLVTGATGIPSIATDIPTAVTIGGQYIHRVGGNDVSVADGGTGVSTLALNGVLYGNDTSAIGATAVATAEGQIIRAGVSPYVPSFTTATYPATITTGQVMYGSATNVISPLALGTQNSVLQAGASTLGYSTVLYPTSITTNQIVAASATNTLAGTSTITGTVGGLTPSQIAISDGSGNLITSTTVPFNISISNDSATTNTILDLLTIQRTTTGTAGDGIGAALIFKVEDASGNLEEAGRIDALFPVAAHATQTGRMSIRPFGVTGEDGLHVVKNAAGVTNVGIGTTGPRAKLDIVTPAGGGVALVVDGNMPEIKLWDQGFSAYLGEIYADSDGVAWTDTRMTFRVPNSGGTLTDAMTLKNGNVGIGTTGPPEKLFTAGTVGIGSYTDVSNYEYLKVAQTAGLLAISAQTAGTGTDNIDITLAPAGTGGFFNTSAQVTIGSGTGITVNNTGNINRQVYKVTTTYAAYSDVDTKKGIVITTLPVKTKLVGAYADTTSAYTGGTVAAATLVVGVTAEDGAEIIASHNVFSGVVTKGLADADMGTGMTRAGSIQGGYLPSWTGTTAIYATLNTTVGNTNALTAGSTTFYLVTERY